MGIGPCTWGDWRPYDLSPGVTPYLDWSITGSGDDTIKLFDGNPKAEDLVLQPRVEAIRRGAAPSNGKGNWVFAGLDTALPVPMFALNPTFSSMAPGATIPTIAIAAGRREGVESKPELSDETVIAGVIDVGMPLGHDRWRLKNGKTRILSAWQMVAPWDLKSDDNLPFGAEFYQEEINALLARHSRGRYDGHLDEQAFNEDTGLLNFSLGKAQLDVAGGISHGAHVLDVVAGADRYASDEEVFRDHVRVIAVNAPSSATFGASGTYFDGYMFHAIKRIADIADKIWEESRTKAERDAFFESKGYKGFPIVINMSFGKQAGSKDTLDEFPSELDQFKKYRSNEELSPVHFVMPVGNDNLARCNAFLEPEPGNLVTLQWCHQPQDHTSNFVEVWSDPGTKGEAEPMTDVRLVTPCGAQSSKPPPNDGTSRFCDVHNAGGELVGRMYQEFPKLPGEDEPLKVRYTLCVAATHAVKRGRPSAPSGLWKITVANPSKKTGLQYVASIQTDQALTPGGGRNLRSYFDDPYYERYDPDTGRRLDSYTFNQKTSRYDNTDLQAANSLVRRHGTMNASAATGVVTRVAGYRASDGLHDPNSSTGRGRDKGQDDGTIGRGVSADKNSGGPTASFPTDDGPAHFGFLAAGAHSGSVRAMQGTSFASSQASRTIINAILDGTARKSASQTLFLAGEKVEENSPYSYPATPEVIETLGAGRLPNPTPRKISRMGRE
ncbi:MAG: hypothetical protein ABJL67_15850 [Sulfitobacter sp.]